MKTARNFLFAVMCVLLSAFCIVQNMPVTHAAGVMRLVIAGHTYTKEYTDLGALALTGWHYSASSDTLTLENYGSTLTPQSEIFVYPYSGNLTVELKGDNYIYTSGTNAMIFIGNVKFTGDGSLTLVSDNSYAINTDYKVTITDSASLNINALAGIMAIKGIEISTSANVNIHTSTRCMYTFGDVKITNGRVRLTGSDAVYSSSGNVFISGGATDVEAKTRSKAFALYGEDSCVEWSANASVGAGSSSPGSPITEYTGQKYFRITFTGTPILNPPKQIYWDDTVIDNAGTTNPVARWSSVENATGYIVKLYYFNDIGYELKQTFTVTDSLSCNFGGYFTTYGKYYFTVQALGDGVDFRDSAESPKSSDFYMFSGDIASRYFIRLPESDYFKIIPESGSSVVYYGESYSFTIEVDPAYTQSEILVWANKARIPLRGGKYTIDKVTENITVTVGGLSLNTYTVNLPESEAFTIYPLPEYSTEVEYGEKFAFSVELADIYMQSQIVVTSNGEVLRPKYGIIYTISNITEDQTVEITGLIRDNYEVTFKNIDGTVISSQTVDHGYKASVPSDPSAPDGMTFAGWTDASGNAFDFDSAIVNHTEVFARFETAKDTDGSYLISNLDELIWFRNEVNFGNTGISGRLTADIEMNSGKYMIVGNEVSFYDTATVWKPIGGYDYSDTDNYVKFFSGSFDGNGHTLSGFYIKHDAMAANASELGIFGVITETASIKNLNIICSYFEGYSKIGAVAGKSSGNISGCSVSAVVSGVDSCGGIAGEVSGDITNCTFSGRVDVDRYSSASSASSIGGSNAGGIAAIIIEKNVNIKSCINNGEISAYDRAGGILGYSYTGDTLFASCINNGTVSSENAAGGIVARAEGAVVVNNSSNTAQISGGTYAGGISGKGDVNGMLNFNAAPISGGTYAGGIVGNGSLDMKNFYSAGNITSASVSGGIAGYAPVFNVTNGHAFSQLSGTTCAALCAKYDSAEVTTVFYCKQYGESSVGTPIHYSWFYCGYAAGLLNRETGKNFWATNGYYPVFANSDNPAFVFELKTDEDSGGYIIENERALHLASAFINNEEGYNEGYYILACDVALHNPDMTDNFIPIGNDSVAFSGYFYAGNNVISGLNVCGTDNVGLFGKTVNAQLESIIVSDSKISGSNYVGGIVGCAEQSSVYGCEIRNSAVNGSSYVGGIAGMADVEVVYSVNDSTAVSGSLALGGIVGDNDGATVSYCYSSGKVSGTSSSEECGGIAGRNFGNISYCANIGDVSAGRYVGGIAGVCYSDIKSVYNAGLIAGDSLFGAICGDFDIDSYASDNCCYLENTAAEGALVIGTAQSAAYITNGTAAYILNANGEETVWAQGKNHPVFAQEDGSDAVIYKVSFYTFDSLYWTAATKRGGAAVAPSDPEIQGYSFVKWDALFNYVTSDVNVRAVFGKPTELAFISTSFLKLNDHEDGAYIYGVYPNMNMTVSQLDAQISNTDVHYFDPDIIYELEPTQRIYTGVTVILYGEKNEWLHIAYVVIYGDVNSDGAVDHNDAFLLNLLADGMLEEYDFTYAQYLAADVNHDGVVDKADSLLVQNATLKNDYINQMPI